MKLDGKKSILLLDKAIEVADKFTGDKLHDLDGSCNHEVQEMLQSGATLAESILKQEKVLLLQLSKYLGIERTIGKEQIEEMARKFGSEAIRHIDFGNAENDNFYKRKLEAELLAVTSKPIADVTRDIEFPVSMNKGLSNAT